MLGDGDNSQILDAQSPHALLDIYGGAVAVEQQERGGALAAQDERVRQSLDRQRSRAENESSRAKAYASAAGGVDFRDRRRDGRLILIIIRDVDADRAGAGLARRALRRRPWNPAVQGLVGKGNHRKLGVVVVRAHGRSVGEMLHRAVARSGRERPEVAWFER